MIICEFMSKGDLHRHLHNIKIKGYMYIDSKSMLYHRLPKITLFSTINQSEAGAMLLSYSRQVASAMVYLSGKGYVHCDLAARNILLSEDGICKVSSLIKLPYLDLRFCTHCHTLVTRYLYTR